MARIPVYCFPGCSGSAEAKAQKLALISFRQNLNRYDTFTKNSRPSLMN
jgi:hypothetical protein